jgi:hypothetical protein
LSKRGLKQSGLKAELAARLQEHLDEQANAPANGDAAEGDVEDKKRKRDDEAPEAAAEPSEGKVAFWIYCVTDREQLRPTSQQPKKSRSPM